MVKLCMRKYLQIFANTQIPYLLSFASVSSRQARSFAEDAFYHPSMMSVSYYSFEHCFAVYSVCSSTLTSIFDSEISSIVVDE